LRAKQRKPADVDDEIAGFSRSDPDLSLSHALHSALTGVSGKKVKSVTMTPRQSSSKTSKLTLKVSCLALITMFKLKLEITVMSPGVMSAAADSPSTSHLALPGVDLH